MNSENKKLGRGLGTLLASGEKKEDKNFKFINISEIQANLNKPRKNFNKEELEEHVVNLLRRIPDNKLLLDHFFCRDFPGINNQDETTVTSLFFERKTEKYK